MNPVSLLLAVNFDQKKLLARFWRSASLFLAGRKPWAPVLIVFLVGVVLLQLLVQVLLNLWNRHFFDALERNDGQALWFQAELFVPLAASSILLAATSVWGRMTTQRSWREALTRQVIGRWLEKDRFRRLNHLIQRASENPEYRIALRYPHCYRRADRPGARTFVLDVDCDHVFQRAVDRRRQHRLSAVRLAVTIPGYLVFGVIIYSGVVSSLMVLFGHHLTGVIERMNQSEAELRTAIDAFRGGDGQAEDAGRR